MTMTNSTERVLYDDECEDALVLSELPARIENFLKLDLRSYADLKHFWRSLREIKNWSLVINTRVR